MRTFIIADIHGCERQLRRLLEKLQPDPDRDVLVLLGDLFDRGPDSWEVFEQVRFLKDIYGSRFVLLRGNHEDYLLRDRLSLRERMVWNRVGRPAAVKSFRAHDAALEDSIPFLKENCRLFYKGEGFQCVHAGVRTDPVEENDTRTLIHDHDTVPQNRYAGPLTVTGHIALTEPRWYAGDERTVKKIPWGEWRDLPTCGIICIDTGCGKGGRLTGMVIRDHRFRLESVGEGRIK